MKKIILGMSAMALMFTTSCCGSSSCDATNDSCIVNGDSLSIAIGAGMGSGICSQINSIPDSAYKAKLSKDEIIEGLEYVLAIDTANVGRTAGLDIGLKLMSQIQYFEKEGVKIDRRLVLEQFKKALMQDSVPMTELFEYQTFIQTADGIIIKEKERKRLEALEKSPEAIQGTKTGEAFINKKKQEDPEIKTTASGLSYKIINEGEGAKATDDDFVKVIYKGSLIDGTVFDDSNGEACELPVRGVVPGFAEGIKLLGKGGKATLYIPGKLGYGVHGQPAAGIGRNQMLVFEVEVKEINSESKPEGMSGKVVK
ncbi:MAG: FKBP-type peptidyl-prolyl cis-trans isomerase [Muribaculaceae bacterium]|nr:FKBP-type peptidyl-prolyl cis-trans isomerase [Muribaculaceae bacterium]